jgi:alpha-D-xyloside xylohydrolase
VHESMVWYDKLRYRLLPYIYTLAADTWHRDGTMLRGLPMDFPDDRETRAVKDQFLFGKAFLVAPVYEHKARTRGVYLPAGSDWYDFHTGALQRGGQRIDAAAPLARMPVYVRAGSIVPTGPELQYSTEKPAAPLTLLVFTGADGVFDYYEDDGLSYRYERNEFLRIPLRFDAATGTLTVGARAGGYPGMPETRAIHVRWIKQGSAAPADFDAAPDATIEYTGAETTVKME